MLNCSSDKYKAARDRFEVGEITRTDISFAESRLEAAKGKLANQIGNLEISIESYKMENWSYTRRVERSTSIARLTKNS